MDEYTSRRAAVFFVSVSIMTLGVVLSAKAGLGTTPISSIPLVVSLGSDAFTIGTATLVMNVVFILLSVLIMRRDYKLKYALEFFLIAIFSIMCDIMMSLFDFIYIDEYWMQWALTIVSMLVMSLGVALEVAANFSMLPGDHLVEFISVKTGMVYGNVKVLFDITMIATSVMLSFMFFGVGEFNGVREGTIFVIPRSPNEGIGASWPRWPPGRPRPRRRRWGRRCVAGTGGRSPTRAP